MIQTSLFDARQARDIGLERTRCVNTEWMAKALACLPLMKQDGHVAATGEGMRIWLTAGGLPAPTSAHAWGSLVRTAMKRGIIKDTGRVVQMFTAKSHARRTQLWEIV